jgi:hypothetical protein
MKNIVFALLLLTWGAQAQVKQLWSKPIPEGVRWQKITSDGNYLIGTTQGFAGVNPETGAILWKNARFGPIALENLNQLGSSPLLSLNLGSEVYMIDPYNGEVRFDSKSAGVNEIKDQKLLFKANGILISGRTTQGKDILLMSSLMDGKIVWRIEEDFGRFVTANELSPEELLIVTIFYNYKLNPKTGKITWRNDVSAANKQLEKMGALGNLMKQAASNAVQNTNLNVQYYQHPSMPVFYIASEQEGKAQTTGFTTTTTTGSSPSYHTTYSAFNLNDGSPVWSQPLDLSGKMGQVYFADNGIVIMPDDGSNTKVNVYDYKTKEGKWGKKGNGVRVKGGIYSYSKVKDGLVLVSQTESRNFISYLSFATMELTFDKPVKIDGSLVYSENIAKGLLYVTTQEVNILDMATGTLIMDKGFGSTPALTTTKDNLLYVFDNREGVLKVIDKTTGTFKNVSAPLKFEGKETPTSIELRNNGILISASQNLALVGFDGKLIYQKYFEAPREPGIIRALQYAQAVRAAYIGAAAYTASAAYQSAGQQVKEKDATGGMLLQGVGQAYNDLGNVATDFAKKSFQQANARFKATKSANDYTVVLTKQENGNVLLKVNKDTGEAGGTINLGKDTAPNYVMDGVTGSVFYSVGGKITGYQF